MAAVTTQSVGVVVVARDRAGTIGRALVSVLDEASEQVTLDVVVVDGASTDGTLDVVAGVPGVRSVIQRGLGLAAARNQGIAAVRGDLIAFVDADDRWASGSLSARLALLEARPDALGVVGHLVGEPISGEELAPRPLVRVGQAVPGFTPGALLARRDAFARVGPFDEGLSVGADSEWFVRARGLGEPIHLLPDIVLHKGLRHHSLSHDVVAYRRELLDVARRYVATRRIVP